MPRRPIVPKPLRAAALALVLAAVVSHAGSLIKKESNGVHNFPDGVWPGPVLFSQLASLTPPDGTQVWCSDCTLGTSPCTGGSAIGATATRGGGGWNCAGGGGGGGAGGYTSVEDEGSALTTRSILNFAGAGVSCVDNGGATRTDCTIPGASAPSFGTLTGGTNTGQSLVVGSGSTLGATGTGSVTATDVMCTSCISLGSEVQGTLPLANITGNATGSFPLLSTTGGGAPVYGEMPWASLTGYPADCGPGNFVQTLADTPTCAGNATSATTATALAADGSNCSSGSAPLGVDASGNAEGCFVVGDMVLGTPQTVTAAKTFNAGTLLDKGELCFDPTGYGTMDPTGVTDAAPAIQAAITAMPAAGASLCLPAGTFLVNSAIPIKSSSGNGVVIRGAGKGGTTLQTAAAGTGYSVFQSVTPRTCATSGAGSCDAAINAAARGQNCVCYTNADCQSNSCTGGTAQSGARISDLKIQLRTDNTTGIDFTGISQSMIENVAVFGGAIATHTHEMGFLFGDDATAISGYSNSCIHCRANALDIGARVLPSGNDTVFWRSVFDKNKSGVVIESSVAAPTNTVQVHQCRIESNATSTATPVCTASLCVGGYYDGQVCTTAADCLEAGIIDLASQDVITNNRCESAGQCMRLGNTLLTSERAYIVGNSLASPTAGAPSNPISYDNAIRPEVRDNHGSAESFGYGLDPNAGPNLIANATMEGWVGTTDLLGWGSVNGTTWDTTGFETQETTVKGSGNFAVKIGNGTQIQKGVNTNVIPVNATSNADCTGAGTVAAGVAPCCTGIGTGTCVAKTYTLTFLWTTSNAATDLMRYGFRLKDAAGALITSTTCPTCTVKALSVSPQSLAAISLSFSGAVNAYIVGSNLAPLTALKMERRTLSLTFPTNTATVQIAWFPNGTTGFTTYLDDVYFGEGAASPRAQGRTLTDAGDQTIYGALTTSGLVAASPSVPMTGSFVVPTGGSVTVSGNGINQASDVVCASCVDLQTESSNDLPWTRLTTYPAPCAAGSFISGLGDTTTCASNALTANTASTILGCTDDGLGNVQCHTLGTADLNLDATPGANKIQFYGNSGLGTTPTCVNAGTVKRFTWVDISNQTVDVSRTFAGCMGQVDTNVRLVNSGLAMQTLRNTPSSNPVTVPVPIVADTLVARATADTLSNKTLDTSDTISSWVVANEVTTPTTPLPSAGTERIYSKAGAGVCGQDSAGVERCTGQASCSNLAGRVTSTQVSNTASETAISTLVLATPVVNRNYRVRAQGNVAAFATQTFTYRLYLGGTKVCEVAGIDPDATADGYDFNVSLTIRTAGASGVVQCSGVMTVSGSGVAVISADTAIDTNTTAVTLTGTPTLESRVLWSAANAADVLNETQFNVDQCDPLALVTATTSTTSTSTSVTTTTSTSTSSTSSSSTSSSSTTSTSSSTTSSTVGAGNNIVRGTSTQGNGGASSTTLNSNSLNVIGGANRLIVVVAAWSGTATSVASITDTAGNTFTARVTNNGGTNNPLELWSTTTSTITGNATDVVTVTWAAATSNRRVLVLQYSGIAASSFFDVTGTGGSTPAQTAQTTTGSSTTSANEVIVAAYNEGGAPTFTAGSGFTLFQGSAGEVQTEDELLTAPGSSNSAMTVSPAQGYSSVHATFVSQ
jgi:hypothetical protein